MAANLVSTLRAEGAQVEQERRIWNNFGQVLASDANQVTVTLVAAGTAVGIKKAVERFRKMVPRAEVTIEDDNGSGQAGAPPGRSPGLGPGRAEANMTDDHRALPAATLDAISELLIAGEQYGIGVSFEPDGTGWRIGYLRGMGGGDLSSAYDLQVAAQAALRPLLELGERLTRNREER